MTYPRSVLRTAALAAPLGVMALSAQAADIVGTIKEQPQLSKLAKAIEQAGMAQSLQGGGPYTVFAPTDQAFEQLPPGTLDELMKEENQDQLAALLQYHVLDGEEIRAKDALGKQTEVGTLAGDRLSIDGSGQVVLIVPAGLTTTDTADRTQQPGGVQTEVTEQGGMPATEHQQQVLGTDPATEHQQTAPEGGDMPSSPHQEQVLSDEQPGQQPQAGATGQTPSQSRLPTEAQTEVTEQGGMPATEHQQQVLGTDPATEQQQTAPEGGDMPSSPHQEQVLSDEQPQGSGQVSGMLREARVIEPDIQADNGVIHAIDAVLVPQSVLSEMESMGQERQSPGQQGDAEQG